MDAMDLSLASHTTVSAAVPAHPLATGSRRSAAMMLLAAGTFGTTGTAIALAGVAPSPIAAGGFRVMLGALVVFAALPMLGGSRGTVLAAWRRPAVLVMALTTAAYQAFFLGAVATTGVARGTLVAVGTAPILAGLLGWLVLGHRPTRRWGIATAIAITGLVLRSGEAVAGGDVLGVLLAIGAALCIAGYNTSARYDLARGSRATDITSSSLILAAAIVGPLVLTQPLAWVATPGGIALILWLGVVTAGLANIAHALALRGLAPGPATTLQLSDPLVATLLGVLVVGETITPMAALGLVLVLAGLALQATGPRERRTSVPAEVKSL